MGLRHSTRIAFEQILLLLGDVSIALLAYLAAFWLRSNFTFMVFEDVMPTRRIYDVAHYMWLMIPGQVVIFYFFGLYEPLDTFQVRIKMRPIISAITLETVLLAAFYFFAGDVPFPRSIFPIFLVLNCIFIGVFRAASFSVLVKGRPKKRAIVIGTSTVARTLLERLNEDPSMRLEVVGVVHAPNEPNNEPAICGFPVLGDVTSVPDILKKSAVDEILIASPNCWQQEFLPDLLYGPRHAHVSIIPSDYEILIGRLQDFRISDVPLIEIESTLKPTFQLAIKRVIDSFSSLIFLLILLPLFIAIGLLVKLTSKGPVFYRQERIGKDEEPFKIIKFRTMAHDAERSTGPVISSMDDDRITLIGRFLRKTRLDELPQLLNIIKGEMSFVGPRPERPVFVEEYSRRIPGYSQRFSVLPGITGLAQIHAGYATIPEIKIKYDLGYIQNFSVWLDLFIILETLKVIVTGHGSS
ncbi:MAG: sugar transferase [Candidatus Coatesbacteria bacterium]|nr:sugar transferase [Candidatus Coatesbacteria bacterium]